MMGCCQTWSATPMRSKPASSATLPISARFLANRSGPPFQSKLLSCIPSFIDRTSSRSSMASTARYRTGSRSAQYGAQLQAGHSPAPALSYEDERRAELLIDVVATVRVLVHALGALAAHHYRRLAVEAYPHLVESE